VPELLIREYFEEYIGDVGTSSGKAMQKKSPGASTKGRPKVQITSWRINKGKVDVCLRSKMDVSRWKKFVCAPKFWHQVKKL
jgi:hypothetical protein